MPQHKSCKKRMKTNEKARVRNRVVKTKVKKAVKGVSAAGSAEEAEGAFRKAASELDSAARKNIIHKNKAARGKSRLAKKARSKA